MTTDLELGDLLVQQNLMTEAQLRTALDFQKSLGGDLRNIVVKLGYVKDSVLADLVAQEENVAEAMEITGDVIDFGMVKTIGKEMLGKHLVLPLKSSGGNLVLAMADPNDLRAIEEIQFRVNRTVEPAVTTKNAIRRALNQLHELAKQREQKAGKKTNMTGDRLKALKNTPVDKLIRAYIAIRIERGEIEFDDLISRVNKL